MSVRKDRSTKWFSRLADAIAFNTPVIIDRSTLAHASFIPEENTSSIDGHHFLTWAYDDHSATSQSPAAAHMMRIQRLDDPDEILLRCCEALELPGTLTDYHHALHLAYERLYPTWKRQRTHESALETLCDADSRLVERDASIIDTGTIYLRVDAYRILAEVYEATNRHDLVENITRRAGAAHQRT